MLLFLLVHKLKGLLMLLQTSPDLPSCLLSSAAPVASGWIEDVASPHFCAGFLWETIGGQSRDVPGPKGQIYCRGNRDGCQREQWGIHTAVVSPGQTLTFHQDSFPLARNSLPAERIERPASLVWESRRDPEKERDQHLTGGLPQTWQHTPIGHHILIYGFTSSHVETAEFLSILAYSPYVDIEMHRLSWALLCVWLRSRAPLLSDIRSDWHTQCPQKVITLLKG